MEEGGERRAKDRDVGGVVHIFFFVGLLACVVLWLGFVSFFFFLLA